MNEVIPKFQDSLFAGISSIIPDIAELGIDSILSEGLLKDIPVVSILLGMKNTAQALHDRNLLRQTLVFISEFNSGNINEKKKQKYKQKIEDDPKKAEAELGRVLIILNRNIDIEKSRILSKLFICYVNEGMSWEDFCDLSEITDRLFLRDIKWLKKVHEHDTKGDDYMVSSSAYAVNRLVALGLISASRVAAFYKKNYNMDSIIHLTKAGKMFCEAVVEL